MREATRKTSRGTKLGEHGPRIDSETAEYSRIGKLFYSGQDCRNSLPKSP